MPGGVPTADRAMLNAPGDTPWLVPVVLALKSSRGDSPGCSEVASGRRRSELCTSCHTSSAPDTSRIATALMSLNVEREPSARWRVA